MSNNINNLKMSFLEDNSIEVGTIAWRAYLDSNGFSAGSIVDDTRALLEAKGHWVGNMSESLYSLYESGGGPLWTLGYNGVDVFGELDNAWTPTGTSHAESVTFYYGGGINLFVFGGAVTGTFLAVGAGGNFSYGNVSDAEMDGVPFVSGSLAPTIGIHTFTFKILATRVFSFIGIRSDAFGFYDGQIHLIELIDNDTPSNSITINNVIQSTIQPVDFNIYNTLKPALGSELNSDVDYNNPAVWNNNSGNTEVTGGKAVWSSAGSGSRIASTTTPTLEVGTTYEATIVIDSISSGAIRVSDALGTILSDDFSTIGEHKAIFTTLSAVDWLRCVGTTTASVSSWSVKETNIIGVYSNGTYEPELQGGGSQYDPEGYGSNVVGKSQQFNGDRTGAPWSSGVDTTNDRLDSSIISGNGGSWLGKAGLGVMDVGDIVIAGNGAGVKVASVDATSRITYTTLLGTDTQIQDGFQYPNVFRVLQDIGGTDNTDEYYYYNNGGLFPWTGA